MNKNLSLFLVLSIAILVSAFLIWNRSEDKDFKENYMNTNNQPAENSTNQPDKNSTENENGINVTIKTNFGDIVLELYPQKAPKTVENFVNLANSEFYNQTKFHRIIKDFMIQGGDPLTIDDSKKQYWGTGGPGYQFEDEPNDLDLEKGVIAMANAGPNTNGSQFFIITAESTPWLQNKHTGFGRVVSGLNIVEEIENSEVNASDQPLEAVIVEEVIVN